MFRTKTSIKVLGHIKAVTLRGIFEVKRIPPTAEVRMMLHTGALDLYINGVLPEQHFD